MYFDRPGKANTTATLTVAAERATALGIGEMIVASTSGATALEAARIAPDMTIIAVTHHCGCNEPFAKSMDAGIQKQLQDAGIHVVMAAHALSGVERSIAKKHGGALPVLVMADTLRLFGQGIKVAVEVTLMAADAGTLNGLDVVAVGGSSHGADAAAVIKPAHMNNLFDMRIREIICKPRDF